MNLRFILFYLENKVSIISIYKESKREGISLYNKENYESVYVSSYSDRGLINNLLLIYKKVVKTREKMNTTSIRTIPFCLENPNKLR